MATELARAPVQIECDSGIGEPNLPVVSIVTYYPTFYYKYYYIFKKTYYNSIKRVTSKLNNNFD